MESSGKQIDSKNKNSQDDKIDLAKELIAQASLILKSKGQGYDRLSWLLEDTLSEIENLQLPQRDSTATNSMTEVMDYLEEVSDSSRRTNAQTSESKEVNQNN